MNGVSLVRLTFSHNVEFDTSRTCFGIVNNRMVHITEIRVRYAETDRMQRVYHGAFVTYLEVARVEFLRSLGWNYREMEESGVMLPVTEVDLAFKKPVGYDELVRIETRVVERPTARIRFGYTVYNEAGEVAVEAHTTLVFVDAASGRPMRAPAGLVQAVGY